MNITRRQVDEYGMPRSEELGKIKVLFPAYCIFDPKMWSIHLCPIVHHWCKFGENMSNTLQDIMLTMIQDAHTDVQDKDSMPPITLCWAKA